MPRAVDGQLQSAINALQAKINADPEIQAILAQNRKQLERTRDRGGSDRDFQNSIRDQVTNIAKRKGYIPSTGQYFLNPNDSQLEPHGGWAGLSAKTRTAIIAAAAAAGTLGLGAAGYGPAAGIMGGAKAGTLGQISGGLNATVDALMKSAAGAGTGAGAGAGGFLGKLAGWGKDKLTDPRTYAPLAVPLVRSLFDNGDGNPGGPGGAGDFGAGQDFIERAYEDAKRNNAMQEARYRRVDPLHEAVTQLAYSRLPTNVQSGPLPRVPLPE